LTVKHQLPPYFFHGWWPLSNSELAATVFRIGWFWQAYQASRDAQSANILDEADVQPWLALHPVKEPLPAEAFPGLNTFLAEQAESVARQEKVDRKEPVPAERLIEPEPEIIRPGMWVLCDAGWGKIVEILDIVRRPLDEVDRSNTFIRLGVIFRPEADRLRAEIDISAKQIVFDSDRPLYACGKCSEFVTTDSNLILNAHNREAHEDLSPSLRRLKDNSLSLTQLRFALSEANSAV
jgi:hypothetical protein